MADRFENFRAIAATDPEIQARYDAGASAVADAAQKLLNVAVNVDDLMQIDALRLAAVTGEAVDMDRAMVELNRLEEVKGLLEERERAERIRGGDEDEVAKLNKLPPAARMAAARDMGLNDLAVKNGGSSVADPATLYKQALLLRPADRISFMRKHGLA